MSTLHSDITEHYGRLARRYDHRWRVYVKQTLDIALEALPLRGTERILDAPCGTGEFMRMVLDRAPSVEVTGIDLVPEMIAVARDKVAGDSRVKLQVADIEALPFRANTFDAVVCVNVLHHLRDSKKALTECERVLRPGGHLVVVAWCRDFWHSGLAHGWFRLFDRTYVGMQRLAQVTDHLKELGLVIDQASRFLARPFYGMMWCVARKPIEVPR